MRAWIDLLLMSLTFFLTIIWNVEIGIAVSVVISLLLVVRDIGQSPLLAVWPGSQLHLIAKLHMRMFTYSLMASWRAAQSLWGIFTTQYVKLRLIEAGNQVPR